MALKTFEQICTELKAGPIGQHEIPVEHTVSLPLPTLRFHTPAYVAFAAPAIRKPGRPMLHDAPDRWWAVSPESGHLIFYARTNAAPIEGAEHFSRQEIPPPTSLETLQATQKDIAFLMNVLAPIFFGRDDGDPTMRHRISELLGKVIPSVLLPLYRAVAGDFFSWLEV